MSVRLFVSQASREWARQLDDSFERWRLKHEIERPDIPMLTMTIEQVETYLMDIPNPALADLHADLVGIVNAIKYQGNPKNAEKVLLVCSAYQQKIQAEQNRRNVLGLSRKKKSERRDARDLSFAQWFMNCSEEILSPHIFEQIKAEALKRAREVGE